MGDFNIMKRGVKPFTALKVCVGIFVFEGYYAASDAISHEFGNESYSSI